MARTPGFSFSHSGLSPFHRSAAGFGVFDIGNPQEDAYYEFTKVNVAWQNGDASDDQYLAALKVYADSFDQDTSEYLNNQQRYKEAKYTLARNKILAQIEHGTKTYDDLLEFDMEAIKDVGPGSQQYRDLRANVESDTNKAAYTKFQKVADEWQAGHVTDDEYLDAFKEYVGKLTNPDDKHKAQLQLESTQYQIGRNKILAQIDRGTKTYDDLAAFDEKALKDGVIPGSQEYRDRRANLDSSLNKAAYSAFTKARNAWQAGTINDQAYLDAYQTYIGKLTNPDDKTAAQQDYDAAEYILGRNAIINQINKGNAQIGDLLVYDQRALTNGVVPGSDEYRTRLGRLQETQRAVFADAEQTVQDKWQQGTMTTAQLLKWYQDQATSDTASGNQQLIDSIGNTIDTLKLRVQDEADTKVVDDFNQGHMAASAFLTYARDARDRYAKNTPQWREWDQRIQDAAQKTNEENLLYRYGLTQQYQDLQRYNQTHKDPPWKGGYTTENPAQYKYIDGQWTLVPGDKTNTPYTPTEDQKKAWEEVQAQVEANKGLLRYIETQIGLVPGGWVNNQHLLSYYQGIQNTYVAGSTEWYQIQSRIDSVQQAIAQDQVYKTIGVTVDYPWTPKDPQHPADPNPGKGNDNQSPGKGNDNQSPGKNNGGYKNPGPSSYYTDPKTGRTWGNRPDEHAAGKTPIGDPITINDFLWALGGHESGNNYSAQNGTTGAFGKYQILPRNWPSWATRAGLPGNAPQTPENQEKVVRFMVQNLYDRLGDWRLVALAWHNGHVTSEDPNDWSLRNQKYVNRVMNKLGSDMWTPTTTEGVYAPNDWTENGGTPGYTPPATPDNTPDWTKPGKDTSTDTPTTPDTSPGKTSNNPKTNPDNPPGKDTGKGADNGDKFLMVYKDGKVVRVSLPSWASQTTTGTDFNDFYKPFQKAYLDPNASSVVIHGVTYKLPRDADTRAAMMADLDQIRTELYSLQSQAYAAAGNTDAAKAADDNYWDAVKDTGSNALAGLDMGRTGVDKVLLPGFTDVPVPGAKPNSGNPIAQGLAARDALQNYIKTQETLAAAAYAKGDYGAALAFSRRIAQHWADAAAQIDAWKTAANDAAKTYQNTTGAELPENVSKDLADLLNWQKTVNDDATVKMLQDLLGDPKTNQPGMLALNPDGTPKKGANGDVVLNPGWHRTLNPATGEVKPTYTAPGPVDPRTGKPFPEEGDPNTVTVPTKIGNTVVDIDAPIDYGVVGHWSDGTAINGKRTYDSQTGKYWYEDPFHPGKWSAYPYDIKLPDGATAGKDKDGNPFVTWKDPATGYTFHMNESTANKGTYVVGIWDPTTGTYRDGTTFTFDSPQAQAVFASGKFTRDTTAIPGQDKDFTSTDGPAFGWKTGNEYWKDATKGVTFPGQVPAANQPKDISQWANPDRAVATPSPTQPPGATVHPNTPVPKASGTPNVNPYTGFTTGTTPNINKQTGFNQDQAQTPATSAPPAKTPGVPNVNPYTGFTMPDAVTTPLSPLGKKAATPAVTPPPKKTPTVNKQGYAGDTAPDVPSKSDINKQKQQNQQAAADKNKNKKTAPPKVEPPPKKKPVVVPHGAVDPRFL